VTAAQSLIDTVSAAIQGIYATGSRYEQPTWVIPEHLLEEARRLYPQEKFVGQLPIEWPPE
jgi:hypothetical protein